MNSLPVSIGCAPAEIRSFPQEMNGNLQTIHVDPAEMIGDPAEMNADSGAGRFDSREIDFFPVKIASNVKAKGCDAGAEP